MGFHSLEIGKSALAAANYGIMVTGQNLSNANTTGYSRQVLNQYGAASGSGYASSALLGAGVSVRAITQVANAYAEKQLRKASSADIYYGNLETCYGKIQTLFNEMSENNALSDSMNTFWDSLAGLTVDFETLASRSTAIEDAITMCQYLNDTASQLRDYRQSINDDVVASVNSVNALLSNIADLNKAIVLAESGGYAASTANDLRDERSALLRQLSELIDIDVTEEANGSCIVSVAGRSLVYYDQVYEMAVKYEKSGDMVVSIPVFARDNYPVRVSGGELAAQMEIRDSILPSYIDDLDQLAATFTWEFNRIYSQSRGDEPYSSITSLNTPVDPSVTLDQLQFKGNIPDGTFQVVNGRLQVIVYNYNTGEEKIVPLEIDLDGRPGPDGEPDMILWDPANPDASNSFINRLQKALDEEFPGAFTVSIDNNWNVSITSSSPKDYGFCFGEDTSGILAVLGMNVFFTGFDAQTIGVNQEVIDNPAMMAVSRSFLSGDNDGLLALVELRDTGLARLGGQTFDGYYQSLTGRLGSEASRNATMRAVKSDLLLRMFNQREAVSGVDEDEETIKLMAYQRAYQSAARYISVVDGLYDTLMNM